MMALSSGVCGESGDALKTKRTKHTSACAPHDQSSALSRGSAALLPPHFPAPLAHVTHAPEVQMVLLPAPAASGGAHLKRAAVGPSCHSAERLRRRQSTFFEGDIADLGGCGRLVDNEPAAVGEDTVIACGFNLQVVFAGRESNGHFDFMRATVLDAMSQRRDVPRITERTRLVENDVDARHRALEIPRDQLL